MKKNILSAILIFIANTSGFAQQERTTAIITTGEKGYKFFVRAGYVIGGTSPIPLPEDIRSIERYNPGVRLSLEGNIQKKFGSKWGVMTGLRIEGKGMDTEAKVKGYGMDMRYGDDRMIGYFTGTVKTIFNSSYVSVPLVATYDVSQRLSLKIGPYLSWAVRRDFSGTAYDGYLRVDEGKMNGTAPTGPTGQKVEIDANNPASYNFSNSMRKFQWGMELGAEWRALTHLNVYAHLDWGLNNAFKRNFNVIDFSMFPIYATMGFAYVF